MTDNKTTSDDSGSVISNGPTNPNDIGGGSVGQPQGEPQTDYKELYEELEKKLGEQGRELGEYRTFFDGVSPLLDKLDKSPGLVKAIIDGFVDEKLAQAAADQRITISDAKIITQAHTQVERDLGKQGYAQATPDQIIKLVEEKVQTSKAELEGKMKDMEDARFFEETVNDFIERTPDFARYAGEVEKWLDKHEEITDIEIAYHAVKGELSSKDNAVAMELADAENAKRIAMNAGGGRGDVSSIPEGVEMIDQLISGRSNPNVF